MIFRTEIEVAPPGWDIGHCTNIMAVGSCFAGNMAARLARAKFPVSANPFGVMFNPVSVAECLDRLLGGVPYTESDLFTDGELWFSFDHHGSLAATTAGEALEKMNAALIQGGQALREAEVVIVTLGTAWVYRREGRVVANCHKRPEVEFTRSCLSPGEAADALAGVFAKLPAKHIILTVSPVRHIRDGLEGNSLGKATLIVAAHELARRDGRVLYFPSYEMVMDDLRDYRFYSTDMLHPSEQAVTYIWDRFCGALMTPSTRELAREVEKLSAAMAHRPLNPATENYREFRRSMHARCAAIADAHPELDLLAELEYFANE